ncbi:MAG: beta-propeller domain-containing protein, partial [Methanobacteriota archaeon]
MMSRILIMVMILLIVPIATLGESIVSGNDSLIEISTQESFKAYLENQTKWYNEIYSRSDYRSDVLLPEYAAMPSTTSALAPSLQKDASGGATDYSTTNVQVAGVDEADYLKNDGRYIYLLREGML